MGGDEIWEAVSEHLGVGHDETTDDGMVTLERVECNAACDYAPVVMANWEFFDNQTPDSTIELVDRLRAGEDVAPTRGAAKVCSFSQVSRVLAGFDDGRADEGVGAGPATLLGLRIAEERGWTAPDGDSAHGSASGGEKAPGSHEVTPADDEARTDKVEPAAERDESDDAPAEGHEDDASGEAKEKAKQPGPPEVVSTGDGVTGVAGETEIPKDLVDVPPPQEAQPGPLGRAANVSAQSASVPVGHDAGAAAAAERDVELGTDDEAPGRTSTDEDHTDGKGD
jgi:NADH-quinone oxidoreductase subunit E